MADLAGRTALITGSSRGIGRGIALALAAHGARVCLHGRDADALDRTRDEVAATGADTLAVAADLTSDDGAERLRDAVLAEWGAPDVLVANAGGNPVPPGPIEDIPLAGWRDALEGNLTATFRTIAAFLPAMKARGHGAIVTVSSLAARSPHERSPAAYAAAKAGVESLTRNLAVQTGPHGIRVNGVAPETILTERNREQIPENVQEQLAAAHPIRRLGTVEDVGAAVAFLASDRAGWISGEILDVAGGPGGAR